MAADRTPPGISCADTSRLMERKSTLSDRAESCRHIIHILGGRAVASTRHTIYGTGAARGYDLVRDEKGRLRRCRCAWAPGVIATGLSVVRPYRWRAYRL